MPRVAILIDGDNISPVHAPRIAALGEAEGRVDVHRAYADATNGSGWTAAPGVNLIHAGSHKNAADLLLSIDAIEIALTGAFDTFILASSDGDFTHLATRLRERGFVVIGVGEEKAPTPYRASCTRFTCLATGTAETRRTVSALDVHIRGLIGEHSRGGSGMRISLLGPQMNKRFGTRISTYPERTWRAYFAARPDLYDLDPRGPDAHVRFKPAGFSV